MVLCHSTTCPIESSHTVLGVLVQSTTLLKVSSSPITCFINYFMAYFQNFHHTMFNSLITVLLGKESPWYNAFVFANYNHMENIIPLKWETNFFSSLLLPFPPLFSLHFLKKKKKKEKKPAYITFSGTELKEYIYFSNIETWVQSLGQEDSLEKGVETHSSILAWENSWTKEPGNLQSIRSQRVGHKWAQSKHLDN